MKSPSLTAGPLGAKTSGLMRAVAHSPVAIAPHVPPTPCTPTTSRASSYQPSAAFRLHAEQQRTPATAPMTRAGIGSTKPDAGVMAATPPTAPLAAPSTG